MQPLGFCRLRVVYRLVGGVLLMGVVRRGACGLRLPRLPDAELKFNLQGICRLRGVYRLVGGALPMGVARRGASGLRLLRLLNTELHFNL